MKTVQIEGQTITVKAKDAATAVARAAAVVFGSSLPRGATKATCDGRTFLLSNP